MNLFAFAIAASLLKGDLPLEQRVEKLTPFFKPAPGDLLALDEVELRNLSHKIAPGKLRGQIVVSPPKGTCFTIQRSPAESDDVICKQTALSFSYSQLDKNGKLNWRVSTGEGDFGTSLSWRTAYRVAVVTPFDKSLDDPPVYRYIKHCDALSEPDKGRRIVLSLVGGESWIIRFPEQDILLPQPDPLPNLFSTQAQGRISVKDAAENNKKKDAAKDKDTAKAAEEPAAQAPEPTPAEAKPPSEEDDRTIWAVPRRGTYTMAASNFQPYGSVASGMKGECRYNFRGPDEDPDTGRLECHDVDGFKQVFIPLTCLGQIRRSK